ncbi:MAG TPA: DUF4105 domain-containing protein [Chryseosolibacter sp.]
MKKLTLLFLLVSTISFGQIQLSDKAEISVLTLGPWQGQVYTAFGHSAFRVNDPANNIDAAYNYGVFNFDRPNFYLNFAKGHNYYMLGVSDYKRFEYAYIYFDRYIHEQKLNLSQRQKQRLFDYLEWNAKPENAEYLYDYFYDNCATKIPAVMQKVFGDTIRFDSSHIKTNYTIRELTDLYLTHQPWGDLGIDICLGLPMDKKATPYEYMFLPDYVEAGFNHATIRSNGIEEPLVKESTVLYESQHNTPPNTLVHPLLVFGIVFLIVGVVSYRDMKRRKVTQWLDIILFTIVGFVGVLLFVLWVATDHKAAAKNLNLLWALPTHVITIFAMLRNPKWLMNYFLVTAIIALLLLGMWPFLPQKLHYALIPLVMALGVRAFTQYIIRKEAVKREMKNPQPA